MNQTFQNSAQVISVGIFFTLMVLGLSTTLLGDDEELLDACAAPGGKTAHLLELADLDLLALDSDPLRLARVQDKRTGLWFEVLDQGKAASGDRVGRIVPQLGRLGRCILDAHADVVRTPRVTRRSRNPEVAEPPQ